MSDLIILVGTIVDHEGATPLAGARITATPSQRVTQTSDGEEALSDASATTDETGAFTLALVYAEGLRYTIVYRSGGERLMRGVLDCDSYAAGATVDVADLPPIAGVPPSAVETLQAWVLAYVASLDVDPAVIEQAVIDYLAANPPGIPDHNDTTNRDAADAHPMASITGLVAELAGKATSAQGALADTAVQPADLTPYATDADLSSHASDTTAVHGIADTSALVTDDDARLSDARTPTAHTHDVGDIDATGTPSDTTYLRGDNTWATPAGGGSLIGVTNADLTALGETAGDSVTTGSGNVFVGPDAGATVTTGQRNTAIGTGSMSFVHGGASANVAVGHNTMRYAEDISPVSGENTAVGNNALRLMTTGRENTALGYGTLGHLTTGGSNIAIGHSCSEELITGGSNVAIGRGAMNYSTAGSANVAIGRDAMFNNMGTGNVAVGRAALQSASTNDTVAVGTSALAATTGPDNTAVGNYAGNRGGGVTGNQNTTGARNTYVGAESGQSGTGQNNDGTAIGRRAVVGASDTVALGSGAQALHAGSVALGKGQATTATDQVRIGGKHVELVEITDPGAPAANGARMYVKDEDGATRLYVRTDSAVEKVAFASDVPLRNIETTSSTSITAAGTDHGKFIRLTATDPVSIELPAGVAVGTQVEYQATSTGLATFTLGSGASWAPAPTPSATMADAGSAVTALCVAADSWTVVGRLAE